MSLRRRLNHVVGRLDKVDSILAPIESRLATTEADVKRMKRSSPFWLSVIGIVLPAVLVVVQCVLLFRQTEIMESQELLTVLQQQQGTDSYDFSVAGEISIERPDAQTVVVENRSPIGLFDSFVQLQGVGGFDGSDIDGAAFAHVLQRLDILASCERVTFRVPSVLESNDYGDSLYLDGARTASGAQISGFSSGSATVVFEGSDHWWAVTEHGGVFRVDTAEPREASLPPDELLLRLDRSLPEDGVLGDTILEGVDLEGLTAISAPFTRDSDLVQYDDFTYEIGRSEHTPWLQREIIGGCPYA